MDQVRSSFMLSWWYIHSNSCVSIPECVIVFAFFDDGHCRKYDTEHTSEDDTNLPTADKVEGHPTTGGPRGSG